MKKIVLFVVVLFAICHNVNARITYDIARKGAQAKVVFKVVDQEGVAVQGAKIWGVFTTLAKIAQVNLPRINSAAFLCRRDVGTASQYARHLMTICHQVKRMGKCCFGRMCIDAKGASHGCVFCLVVENLSAKLQEFAR